MMCLNRLTNKRKMQTLLGTNSMSETVLKQMWLDKLNPDIVQILTALTDEVGIQKLTAIADKIIDTRPTHQIASVVSSNDSPPNTNQQLQAVASELRKLNDIQKHTKQKSEQLSESTQHSTTTFNIAAPPTPSTWFLLVPRGVRRARKKMLTVVFIPKHTLNQATGETNSLATIKGVGCQG